MTCFECLILIPLMLFQDRFAAMQGYQQSYYQPAAGLPKPATPIPSWTGLPSPATPIPSWTGCYQAPAAPNLAGVAAPKAQTWDSYRAQHSQPAQPARREDWAWTSFCPEGEGTYNLFFIFWHRRHS